MKINANKLTGIDRQILSLFEMNQARVQLTLDAMELNHEKLGTITLERKRWRLGLYMTFQSYSTNNRMLSWRGRLLARRLHKRLLVSPMNEVQHGAPPFVQANTAQPYSHGGAVGLNPAGQLTGAAMPLTAKETMQRVDNYLRSQWLNQLQNMYPGGKFPSPP